VKLPWEGLGGASELGGLPPVAGSGPAVAREVWDVYLGTFTRHQTLRNVHGLVTCEASRVHFPDLPGPRGASSQLTRISQASPGNLANDYPMLMLKPMTIPC
jgi:hypothetical protein